MKFSELLETVNTTDKEVLEIEVLITESHLIGDRSGVFLELPRRKQFFLIGFSLIGDLSGGVDRWFYRYDDIHTDVVRPLITQSLDNFIINGMFYKPNPSDVGKTVTLSLYGYSVDMRKFEDKQILK